VTFFEPRLATELRKNHEAHTANAIQARRTLDIARNFISSNLNAFVME